MASLNKAMIIGFIGQEPKVDTLNNGTKVATLSIATTEKGYTLQNGTTVPDRTEWHNVVLWGKLAEIAGAYLRKGSSVYIEGKIRTRSYDDKNGVKRYTTEIVGDMMQMLDRKSENNQTASQQHNSNNTPTSGSGDDLPF